MLGLSGRGGRAVLSVSSDVPAAIIPDTLVAPGISCAAWTVVRG
jgi:hypothetical protein